jgi:phosphatidylinositol alpha-1,6-mannosyltransferase
MDLDESHWLELAVSKVGSTLFITNDFGPRAGGIETFLIGLIERIPRDKKSPFMVYTSAQADTADYDDKWLRDYGIQVIRDRSKILIPTPRVIAKARALMREVKPINVIFGAAAPLAVMAPSLRKAGAKNIVALTHGHEVWWAKIPPFSWAMRFIGKSVDHLTYLGEYTRKEISKGLSATSRAKQVHIAPGIDVDHFAPNKFSQSLRRSLQLENKAVIVSVGRLVHRKGQDRLISALPAIQKVIPNAHLLLVGEGPYRNELDNLVRSLNVEDSVTFVGRITYDRLPAYILR